METNPETENRGEQNAHAELAYIMERVAKLQSKCEPVRERAEQELLEDSMSVETRSDWHTPGVPGYDYEYRILLSTGGPATRVIGELEDNQPCNARLEYQDWGTPWTEYATTVPETEALLAFARLFCFS